MSLQLRVVHRTGFVYEGLASASYNEARMTPLTTAEQNVLRTRLEVTPSPWAYSYTDYWGTQVTAFEVHEHHDDLTVTAISTIALNRAVKQAAGLGWDAVEEPALRDRYCEYLAQSERVEPGGELREAVADLKAGAGTPGEFAEAVCDLVHREVRYVTGATEVNTTARDAWEARSGVCQDMAHLAIGCLRAAGVPARYVSGYLHPVTEPEVGETVRGESHSWVEWWDGDWFGHDVANASDPHNRHIVVGRGRDYDDTAPLRGIFSGASTSQMFVDVEITRLP